MSEETTSEAPEEVTPLSPEAQKNHENVERLAIILRENEGNASAETFNVVHDLVDNIYVRDGFLNKFVESDGTNRINLIKAANAYLVSVAPTYAENGIEKFKIGNYTSFLTALVYSHAGANTAEELPNEVIEPYINIVDKLLLSADAFETEWSLTKLMKTARRNNVPNRIFYESIKATSYNECIGER